MKITIAGTGYVGLSLATLLSQQYKVAALDIIPEKVGLINRRISPIKDPYIEKYFSEKHLNLTATTNFKEAITNADFVIICTPTNYDDITNHFDTTSVEEIIEKTLDVNSKTTIVIKSTVPVGYTNKIRQKYHTNNIFFSPEFLREGNALHDNLYPSRIIIGAKTPTAHKFGNILRECALNDPPILFIGSTEAEAVKLFANTYLALRIAYFNELDTYAELNHLKSKDIINGICLDPRIGNYYNNPSFGYGGYCLPKDTKQLLANFHNIPQHLISATIKSNQTRKQHISDTILSINPKIIGIYRLTMKANSDNFRSSAILDIIKQLEKITNNIIIYEPTINTQTYNNYKVINDLDKFIEQSDIILANRLDDKINKHKNKVYTRDLFQKD